MNWEAKINNFISRLFSRKPVPTWEGHARSLPNGRTADAAEASKKALELGLKSTWVNAWYPHRYSTRDSGSDCGATVRGPFCRWLEITKGGGWDSTKPRPPYVADAGDDADFIAFALNNVESIAQHYLALLAATDNPSLVDSVNWKIKYERLEEDHEKIHDRYGRSFSLTCDLADQIEKLKEENQALKASMECSNDVGRVEVNCSQSKSP